jgi:hypothetical protein
MLAPSYHADLPDRFGRGQAYPRRRAPGENQPTRRSQAPRTEPPLADRGYTAGHGEIHRPVLGHLDAAEIYLAGLEADIARDKDAINSVVNRLYELSEADIAFIE